MGGSAWSVDLGEEGEEGEEDGGGKGEGDSDRERFGMAEFWR